MADATSPRRLFETRLAELVEKFDRHRAAYLRADYPESQARIDFIDPLFEALGWDVRNEAGLGPAGREVVVEQGDTAGRPDYNFRLDGRTVFFVEAKAPHVPLERADVVMQAKQYAWNSKDVFVAAVTDFEEFRLYDATVRPDRKHPDVGLIFAHRYGDYLKPKALDDLWLLSKESVAAGSIDQLLKMSSVKQRQRMPVDEAFLDDLSGWREQLAKAVYKTHPDLAVADLNSVVQVFLDRLVFIRIAEDRGILKPRGLEDIARLWEHSGKRRSIVADLNALFHEVNALLNGEIFKPHLCEKIDWDASADLVVKIVRGLYDGPYKFDYIGVELLGSIYERYLGKTIRVTATRAIVEDKPEVRKAGGVYYTPKYIVDYIVDQTVGRLIEGKTPAQIAKLRILDPACGSGSFLLGAYQKLLNYHQRYKAEHRAKKRKAPAQPELIGAGDGGEVKLSLEEKAAILRNNLYGVDIDPQAVEITMMSLYIKMLEGERGLIAGRGVLPPLKDNIKCGNSLIGHDIREMEGISEVDLGRINPFDWNSRREGFGEIMAAGGFDAVIGNPPYVRIGNIDESLRPYLYQRYDVNHRFDIYIIFIQRAFELLSKSGVLGFIVPNKFFTADYGASLRSYLSSKRAITQIVDFGDSQVFEGATTYTCLLFLSRTIHDFLDYQAAKAGLPSFILNGESVKVDVARLGNAPWAFMDVGAANLFARLGAHQKLGVYCDIARGLETGFDNVFLLTAIDEFPSQKIVTVTSEIEPTPFKIERAVVRRAVKGSVDIHRYYIEENRRYLLFPYHHDKGESQLIDENTLQTKYPLAWNYLTRHASSLKSRKGKQWYAFRRRNYDLRDGVNRLLIPSIAKQLSVACDIDGQYHFIGSGGGGGGGYGLTLRSDVRLSMYYLLGILNSTLLDWTAKKVNSRFGSGYYAFNRQYIEPLPIRSIDFTDPADGARHDKIVSLVERMLELHKQKQSATSEATRARLEREINITDEQIDKLVYELYGLTKEEIRIVEGAGE